MRNIFILLAAAAAPVPPPELQQFRPFVGTSSCLSQVEESPLGPAHQARGSLTARRDRRAFWLQIRYQDPDGASEERWSWDPGLKKFVALLWDSFGGYGQGTSPGWEGDNLVWTGEVSMNVQKMPYRQTFTRAKDGSISESWEMQMNGAWTKLTSGTCKRPK